MSRKFAGQIGSKSLTPYKKQIFHAQEVLKYSPNFSVAFCSSALLLTQKADSFILVSILSKFCNHIIYHLELVGLAL
jgi:hypothetical protein